MAEQYPNQPTLVSHVAVPGKRVPLEECISLSAQETVAGRRAGSAKCTKCLQVCGKKHLRVWLPTTCMPWQAKDALFIPLPPGLPASDPPLNNFDQEDAEPQYEEDESQNDVWQVAFESREEVEKSAVHPRLGAMSVHKGHNIFHLRGLTVCVKMWRLLHVGEPTATSRLSWEPVETGQGGPQENGEPRNPTVKPRVASLR